LLSNGDADVNLRDDRGATPLHWAVRRGHRGSVALLLATGKADINAKVEGETAISDARRKKHEAIVALLLGTGNVIVDG
jgi:ankyrin repeat protein